MYKITPHFSLEEFEASYTASKHGIDNSVPARLLGDIKRLASLLEDIRLLVGKPIHITSGYRCPELNSLISSSNNSQHMYGQAADIYVRGMSALKLAQLIDEKVGHYDQLIYEGSIVHVSVPSEEGHPRRMPLTQTRTDSGRYKYHAGIHDWI